MLLLLNRGHEGVQKRQELLDFSEGKGSGFMPVLRLPPSRPAAFSSSSAQMPLAVLHIEGVHICEVAKQRPVC